MWVRSVLAGDTLVCVRNGLPSALTCLVSWALRVCRCAKGQGCRCGRRGGRQTVTVALEHGTGAEDFDLVRLKTISSCEEFLYFMVENSALSEPCTYSKTVAIGLLGRCLSFRFELR